MCFFTMVFQTLCSEVFAAVVTLQKDFLQNFRSFHFIRQFLSTVSSTERFLNSSDFLNNYSIRVSFYCSILKNFSEIFLQCIIAGTVYMLLVFFNMIKLMGYRNFQISLCNLKLSDFLKNSENFSFLKNSENIFSLRGNSTFLPNFEKKKMLFRVSNIVPTFKTDLRMWNQFFCWALQKWPKNALDVGQ